MRDASTLPAPVPAGSAPLVIVSGGQTGVDRAALDAARALGLPSGGWCPAGRRAEDGPIAAAYPLRETPSAEPAQRTAWNVRDSDATLLLVRGEARGGTALALAEAQRRKKPYLVVDLAGAPCAEEVRAWLAARGPRVANIAGPRESEAPGIYAQALGFLTELLEPLARSACGAS